MVFVDRQLLLRLSLIRGRCPSYKIETSCFDYNLSYPRIQAMSMISREQLKLEIDSVDDANIEIMHRIILALQPPVLTQNKATVESNVNPLKGSILFEEDLISPIDVDWDAEA